MLKKINTMMHELMCSVPLDDDIGKQLRKNFILNYIHNSLAIEGSKLTIDETKLILFEEASLKHHSLKEHVDIFSELAGYLKVEYLLSQKEEINLFSIKELHRKLDKHSSGNFRQERMLVSGIPNQLPLPEQIPRLVGEIIEQYNFAIKGTPLIHRLAYFHLNFEMIHPFPSKNGSLGRLLVNLGLMGSGYPPIIFKKEDKDLYYTAFSTYYQSGGNGEMMCKLFEKYIIESLENYSKYQKKDKFVIIGR
ncbi:MAG: Fic family protein [Filifactoraceae bacterium]